MKDEPEKFFMAHRVLSSIGLGGFGIRFTVQFNLFAGSIVGLAGPEQYKMLDKIQDKGELGCFLLTENQAGVLSGLIVETTADWDEASQEFILHTPSDKAAKNWISQGYTAELGVVIADLRIKGKSYGPHPFFMQLREDGKLCKGIRIDDMGTKTIANDLDNARVWFDQVRLPNDALLNKFCKIENNEYVQVGEERMRIEVIGQRLLTGRLAIAESALYSARVLLMKTEKYAQQKVCNGLAGKFSLCLSLSLSSEQQTSALYFTPLNNPVFTSHC
jgi:acyl-CoA oxidase